MSIFLRRFLTNVCIIVALHVSQTSRLNLTILARAEGRPVLLPSLLNFGVSAIAPAKTLDPLLSTDIRKIRRTIVGQYGWAIKHHARLYGVDWRLILAVIKQESQFQTNAVSYAGALGLMQIMPGTATHLARELGLKALSGPSLNIQGGTYYFSHLLQLFDSAPPEDRMCLALAAYNAGPGRIYDAQRIAAYLGENPNSWQVIERMLPLLSKCHYSLHQSIWPDGKPHWGYFGDFHQTLSYVNNVVANYAGYKSALTAGG